METLDLNNKQNGQKLLAAEWNTLVNTINLMIEVLNLSGTAVTKLSQLTNDAGFITLNDVPEGRSAYLIAIDNGFNGTVEEWIESLKGADGTMSFEDLTEEQRESLVGETGPAGPSAYQSYLDTTTDNPKLSEADWIASLHGQDGSVGPQGLTGQNGITPHIGDNGHWFIGDTDTNVIAQGLTLFKTINGEEITGEGDITINGGSAQVQANWNESDNTKVSYILNKPSIPTKTSDLTNDKNFVTKLALQTDYYTKIEINNKLGDIGTVSEVVDGEVVSRDATVEDKINELLNTISEVDYRHDLNKIYNSFYDLTWFTSTTCKLKIDENTTSELSYNRYFALMLFEMSAMSKWVPIGRIQIKGTSENSYSNLLINLLNYDGTNVTTFKMLGHFSINLNSIIEVLSPNNLESYNEYIITASWSGIDITILNYKKLNADYSYDEPTSTLNINQ